MPRARRISLALSAGAALLCACAAVLGIDDGHPRADAGDDGGTIVIPTLPDGAPIPTGCEETTIDPAAAVFVASSGTDGPTCGALASPCKTVQAGIDRAHDSTATPNVYVASGSYIESITLKSGANVYGGWIPSPSGWKRECSQLATTIIAPAQSNVTVTASSIAGSAKLSTLTIVSKVASEIHAGDSLVGILASGADTTLSFVWLAVRTESAGEGAAGADGVPGASPTTPCDDAGTGASPAAPGAKGPGAEAGVFAATGYVVGNGGAGGPGAPGENGRAGGAGQCADCVSCSGGTLSCATNAATPSCGTAGRPGCGGGGGLGGGGGASGGSSVALLVWDAKVDLQACALQAGNGGNGGAGGAGGASGNGSKGAAGNDSKQCPTACVSLAGIGCSGTADAGGVGGDAGGPGGNGAAGGAGGDGAGGSSFAYVEGGNAKVTIRDPLTAGALSFGRAGATADGGNGASGKAGPNGS